MDKIKKYKQIVTDLMQEIQSHVPKQIRGVEEQFIFDQDNGHFIHFGVGWQNDNWVYASYIHIDVKPTGRVWVQHDGTDLIIADRLVERGIPSKDIVIGFQPPQARSLMTEFATA
jgi:XisI protein